MIDFTEITLHEPLPDITALNHENIALADKNKLLKNALSYLIIGVLIYWAYKYYGVDREQKTTSMRKP